MVLGGYLVRRQLIKIFNKFDTCPIHISQDHVESHIHNVVEILNVGVNNTQTATHFFYTNLKIST